MGRGGGAGGRPHSARATAKSGGGVKGCSWSGEGAAAGGPGTNRRSNTSHHSATSRRWRAWSGWARCQGLASAAACVRAGQRAGGRFDRARGGGARARPAFQKAKLQALDPLHPTPPWASSPRVHPPVKCRTASSDCSPSHSWGWCQRIDFWALKAGGSARHESCGRGGEGGGGRTCAPTRGHWPQALPAPPPPTHTRAHTHMSTHIGKRLTL